MSVQEPLVVFNSSAERTLRCEAAQMCADLTVRSGTEPVCAAQRRAAVPSHYNLPRSLPIHRKLKGFLAAPSKSHPGRDSTFRPRRSTRQPR
jgi:hypothetical protein